jgi:hypothetical protein
MRNVRGLLATSLMVLVCAAASPSALSAPYEDLKLKGK